MRNKLVMGLAVMTLVVALSDCDYVKDMTEDLKQIM